MQYEPKKNPKIEDVPRKKVGDRYYVDGKLKTFRYRDIEYVYDYWVDVNKFLPDDYDIVYLQLTDGRGVTGWLSGNTWEGLRLKPEDEIVLWKRKPEDLN